MDTVDHPRKPVRLDGDALLPHPLAADTNCVVWFPVPDATPGGPEAEGVPAQRLDGDRVRLTGIPFFPYHAGLGDEVHVREQDGTLYAVEVVEATSELVIRVFDDAAQVDPEQALTDPASDEPFWRLARALAAHGAWFERYSSNYAALQVDAVEWEYVQPFLDLRSRVEGLQWELATPMRVANPH
ncbi:MAG: hypothetical protein JWO69_478 [Thermoleophilia bacterium]|nr:hypothetical protein [Thermoleophilia bacterium]